MNRAMVGTPTVLSDADRARWIDRCRVRISHLDARIARCATSRRGNGQRKELQAQRERLARYLVIYEGEVRA